jgi:drug/metabolite transporter (DMT)-like permease
MKKDIERFGGGRCLNSVAHRWIADSVLLLVAFIWGTTFVLVQNAIETLPPFTFLAIRFSLAGMFLLLIFRWRGVSYRIPLKHVSVGAFIGMWLFLGYALQTFSLLYTTSGKSGFLTGLSVAMVPIWSLVLLGVKPRPTATVGVLLAVAGLYLLAFADFSSINRGDILALLCAVAFGLQIVYTAKYAPKVETLHLVTIQIFTVALLSGGCSLLFEPWEKALKEGAWSVPAVYTALLITAFLATSLAYLAQTHFQTFTTPTRVALIFAMEPVFAALADYWWMDVALETRTLAGCILIFAGMVLAEIEWPPIWRKHKENRNRELLPDPSPASLPPVRKKR